MGSYTIQRPFVFILVMIILIGCSTDQKILEIGKVDLAEIAHSEFLWTGVAVSKEGRIFVNYPRWGEPGPISVGEIIEADSVKPYPDRNWNRWDPSEASNDQFICVQSLYVDQNDFLWILDPAPVWFEGVTPGSAKLIKVDLKTDRVVQCINFSESVAPPGSYLNDVRVDNRRGYAYLTDSGLGAIIVTNLTTKKSRRLLIEHPSTKSENITLTIEGEKWLQPDGSVPQIHSDGLALDPTGQYLYYQALTGRSLYRIATEWLRDENLNEQEIGEKVEFMGATGAADGIIFGRDENLYLTAIENNAIKRFTPEQKIETVIQDSLLSWPDGFAVGPDGTIYVTTSQLHRLFKQRIEPYRLFKLLPDS